MWTGRDDGVAIRVGYCSIFMVQLQKRFIGFVMDSSKTEMVVLLVRRDCSRASDAYRQGDQNFHADAKFSYFIFHIFFLCIHISRYNTIPNSPLAFLSS